MVSPSIPRSGTIEALRMLSQAKTQMTDTAMVCLFNIGTMLLAKKSIIYGNLCKIEEPKGLLLK